jgi:hypothetical protein
MVSCPYRSDETAIVKMTHDVAEKDVIISKLEMLALHCDTKYKIMEERDRENRDHINSLNMDLLQAHETIDLLKVKLF